ncbi:MAG: hypothetical protein AAGA87_17320 [Pseudomonadota bacterium]
MRFVETLRRFRDDEDGAITVDWVVLTAAVVGLSILVFGEIQDAVVAVGESIAAQILSVLPE